jgi:hypothetical protein
MSAATHRDAKVVFSRKVDCIDDIGHTDALGDYGGALVGGAIPNYASFFIAIVAGGKTRSTVTRHKGINDVGVDSDGASTVAFCRNKFGHGAFLAFKQMWLSRGLVCAWLLPLAAGVASAYQKKRETWICSELTRSMTFAHHSRNVKFCGSY